MEGSDKQSYSDVFLDERGFIKHDKKLIVAGLELAIWQIRVDEKYSLPKFSTNRTTNKLIFFVKQAPTTLAMVNPGQLSNVLLLEANTELGATVDEKNSLQLIPTYLEKSSFYSFSSGIHIKAKEDIDIYIIQDKNHKVYFPHDLKQQGFEEKKIEGVVRTTRNELNNVWHRKLRKDTSVDLTKFNSQSQHPILFVKKGKICIDIIIIGQTIWICNT